MHPHSQEHHFRARTVDLALEPHALQMQLASPAELRFLIEMLKAWMRILRYPKKDIFAVRLALNEAAIDAFRHGNRADPGKSIHVRYLVTAAEILLQVEDQGPGFDPDQVLDPLSEPFLDRPCGRGLFLTRSYMTWVSFNREGNRVTLCKYCQEISGRRGTPFQYNKRVSQSFVVTAVANGDRMVC
jgi:serine/threonine-protein kinase RsbW